MQQLFALYVSCCCVVATFFQFVVIHNNKKKLVLLSPPPWGDRPFPFHFTAIYLSQCATFNESVCDFDLWHFPVLMSRLNTDFLFSNRLLLYCSQCSCLKFFCCRLPRNGQHKKMEAKKENGYLSSQWQCQGIMQHQHCNITCLNCHCWCCSTVLLSLSSSYYYLWNSFVDLNYVR